MSEPMTPIGPGAELLGGEMQALQARVESLEAKVKVIDDRSVTRYCAGWGSDMNDGLSEMTPKRNLLAARDIMFNARKNGNPFGILQMLNGTFEIDEPFTSGAGGLTLRGVGSIFSTGSTIRRVGDGDAIRIEPIGSGSMHGTRFENFRIEKDRGSQGACFDVDAGYGAYAHGITTKGGQYGWFFSGAATTMDLNNCSGAFHNKLGEDGVDRGALVGVGPDPGGGRFSSMIGVKVSGSPECDGCGSLLYWHTGGSGVIQVDFVKCESAKGAHGADESSWRQIALVEIGPDSNDLSRLCLRFGTIINNIPGITETFIRQLGGADPVNVCLYPNGERAFWAAGKRMANDYIIEDV